MPKSRRRRRAADAARLPVSPPEYEAVVAADRKFFERFAGRNYRIRLMARAELEQAERGGFHFGPPREGMRWVAVMRNLAGHGRLKSFVQLPEDADLDMSEAFCRELYHQVTPEDAIVRGDMALRAIEDHKRGRSA